MKEESVLKLEIVKANDEDGISINVNIQSENGSFNLINLLNVKGSDKFIVISDYNPFNININKYIETEATIEEISEGIEMLEADIVSVRDMGKDAFFSMIEEDAIDTRLVAETLVLEDADRHMMKEDLFNCLPGDIVDTAINCFEHRELVEFIIDCAANGIIKRTTMLHVMLNCYCEYFYEYIIELFRYVQDYDFTKLIWLCEKNKRTNQLLNWRF